MMRSMKAWAAATNERTILNWVEVEKRRKKTLESLHGIALRQHIVVSRVRLMANVYQSGSSSNDIARQASAKREREMRWDIKLKKKERSVMKKEPQLLLLLLSCWLNCAHRRLSRRSRLSSFLCIWRTRSFAEQHSAGSNWRRGEIYEEKNKSTKRTERISCRRRRSVRWLSSSRAHTWWRRRRRCVEERREVKYKNKSPYSMPTSENTSRIKPKSRADQSWRL